MAIRTTKPTSAGRRGYSFSDQSDITATEPLKKLLAHKSNTGGRNNHGRVTSRFRGGGHKRRYRIIDFRRSKIGVPATVATIEYDPNRTARIALLNYADGEKTYILAPDGLKVGDQVRQGDELCVIEAMKMGNSIKAPRDGIVREIPVTPGQTVAFGAPLIVLG